VIVKATVTACPESDTLCDGSCVNLQTDLNNCGQCDNYVCSLYPSPITRSLQRSLTHNLPIQCQWGCDSGTCAGPPPPPPLQCAGGSCSNFIFNCNLGNPNCFCVTSSEGGSFCAAFDTCDTPCSSSSDCGADSVCAIDSCCAANGFGSGGFCTESLSACQGGVPGGPGGPPKVKARDYFNAAAFPLPGVWIG
jgi:hypothetical protein